MSPQCPLRSVLPRAAIEIFENKSGSCHFSVCHSRNTQNKIPSLTWSTRLGVTYPQLSLQSHVGSPHPPSAQYPVGTGWPSSLQGIQRAGPPPLPGCSIPDYFLISTHSPSVDKPSLITASLSPVTLDFRIQLSSLEPLSPPEMISLPVCLLSIYPLELSSMLTYNSPGPCTRACAC